VAVEGTPVEAAAETSSRKVAPLTRGVTICRAMMKCSDTPVWVSGIAFLYLLLF
jgi:hypothetical protein